MAKKYLISTASGTGFEVLFKSTQNTYWKQTQKPIVALQPDWQLDTTYSRSFTSPPPQWMRERMEGKNRTESDDNNNKRIYKTSNRRGQQFP